MLGEGRADEGRARREGKGREEGWERREGEIDSLEQRKNSGKDSSSILWSDEKIPGGNLGPFPQSQCPPQNSLTMNSVFWVP